MHKLSDCEIRDFCSTIIKMGLEEQEKQDWLKIFKHHISDCLNDMRQDVTNLENKLLDNIEKLLAQSESLCKQLRIKMPDYGSKCLSLYKEEAYLQNMVKQ